MPSPLSLSSPAGKPLVPGGGQEARDGTQRGAGEGAAGRGRAHSACLPGRLRGQNWLYNAPPNQTECLNVYRNGTPMASLSAFGTLRTKDPPFRIRVSAIGFFAKKHSGKISLAFEMGPLERSILISIKQSSGRFSIKYCAVIFLVQCWSGRSFQPYKKPLNPTAHSPLQCLICIFTIDLKRRPLFFWPLI